MIPDYEIGVSGSSQLYIEIRIRALFTFDGLFLAELFKKKMPFNS